MKTCCKCKTKKQYSEFYANKRMKGGYNSFCILCHKSDNILRKEKNRQDSIFKAKELEYKKEYRARTVEQRTQYMKEWHSKNAEQQIVYRAKYRKNNPTYFKDYAQKNKHLVNARTRQRQAAKLKRTPSWLTDVDFERMQTQYQLAVLLTKVTGSPWEVDHIIPLQGKLASGLHIPSNLQVIPMKQNRVKSNHMEL